MTGCSDYFEQRCVRKITEYAEEFINTVPDDPKVTFEHFSRKQMEFPKFDEFQEELFNEYVDKFSDKCEIGTINVDEKRKSATIEITLKKAFVAGNQSYVGDIEYVNGLVKEARKDVTIELKLKRLSDGWAFEDLTPLKEIVFDQYACLSYVSSDGFPLNMTADDAASYMDKYFVDALWYDPIEGNPTDEISFRAPQYLECVFYFNQPQYISIEVHLMNGNEDVFVEDMVLNGDIVADCNFGYDFDDKTFEAGTYKVVLMCRDFVLAESSTINVR